MVMSGSQRSKEDDVQKISTSVFVTNFPDGYGAKDLWNTCKLYGHVVDVFIPYRRTKAGNQVQNVGMEECPNVVLDETCLNHEDFSLCLLGKVKEFASLINLKVVLGKEGYVNIELKYMGGFWVMIVFQDDETKKRFQFNLAVGSWFSQIIQAHTDFVIDERVIWVEVPEFEEDGEEGYDVNDGSHEDDMYGGVSENHKDVEGESDREEVPETNFEEVPAISIFEGNSVRQNDVHSKDPFGIYEVFDKKRDGKNIYDKHKDSLKYLHGFTPNEEGDVPVEKVDNWSDENKVNDGQEDGVCVGQHVHARVEVSNDTHESTCFGHFKMSEVPRKGGSILELIDDLVNVGRTMGYDMTGFVIMGYFNEVCDISEWFGSIFNKHGAEAFNSFIVNAGLVEVPLGGCSYTWCLKFAKKMNKLDRFLISDNLMCSCPRISSTSLDRFLSDHRPIIMRDAHYDYRPIPFKFLHYCKFMNKLKYLKEKIQIWTRLHKESLNSRKSILKAELADLDGVINKGEGSDADSHQRREVIRLIQEVEKVDAMEVAQKAKIKWSIEGDENSKYYHGVLNKKRGRLTIRGVLVDERDFVKRNSLEQNDDLEREVSNEEITRAVWDCGIDKAPRPDGFTFGFYRRYWDIIGNDVVDAVKYFRPISLIGSLYKVIAKVLANRLVTVLDDIVDEIQSAFVTDRQILDGPFILNEIVYWCKNKKKQSMIFKNLFVRFFNGADVNSKKPSWVRWKSVLAAKDNGGLEVRVVNALHDEDGKIGKKVQPSFITLKRGNGANTSFWDVAWCGDIVFKNLVPRLYALESMKNIEVASKLSHEGLEFSFRRNPIGGVEQAQFERLKEMVEGVTLSNSNDRWSWSLVGSGDFSLSSVRKLIDNAILPNVLDGGQYLWIKAFLRRSHVLTAPRVGLSTHLLEDPVRVNGNTHSSLASCDTPGKIEQTYIVEDLINMIMGILISIPVEGFFPQLSHELILDLKVNIPSDLWFNHARCLGFS
nr:RNA-directed DNA polymerase, eukaryota, reverse transcriptase zinc-binding domain protein [Tanacetum cinerariifolium]